MEDELPKDADADAVVHDKEGLILIRSLSSTAVS